MKYVKTLATFALLTLSVSCANSPITEVDSANQTQHSESNSTFEMNSTPNQYGWDKNNCAHIKADGHCAHPTGVNPMAPQTPNASGWNESNCAHVRADGSCAHKL